MRSGHRFFAFGVLLFGFALLSPAAAEAAPKKHVVVAGESLWKIAHQNGVGVAALRKQNGIKDNGVLKTGQVITIPEATDKPKRAPAAKASHHGTAETGKAAPKAATETSKAKAPHRGTAKKVPQKAAG
jgi:LysM repeat protein